MRTRLPLEATTRPERARPCPRPSAGYEITRQKGSHIRLTRTTEDGQSHITIPDHDALRGRSPPC